MATKEKAGYRPNLGIEGDVESMGAIYEGANRSQLKSIFHVPLEQITAACMRVPPAGERRGAQIWRIHEVAPYIVRTEIPDDKIAAHIKRMHARDLPMMLRKEFWAGEKARQDVMERAGDLWPTTKVIERVGDLLKLFRMTALLMTDAVERNVELSERQRAIIKGLTDNMLAELMTQIQKNFAHDPDRTLEDDPNAL